MSAQRSNRLRAGSSTGAPWIVLTGRRDNDQYRIYVDEREIPLPFASFEAFVALVDAMIQSESGFTNLPKATVYRLRKALGARSGLGKRLIQTGGGEEYRLAIPDNRISSHIGVSSCFAELAPRLLDANLVERLKKHCRKVIALKPSGDRAATDRRPKGY